ncbi:hypothetical protein SAZ11_59180 [Streptomyces sp. FXJ1.4098]|nr:hypothetical protein [Streptomyces sp. FXJ1.4098]
MSDCASKARGHAALRAHGPAWSTEALAAADHPTDLAPDGRTHLHLDHAQYGLGSASCGPGPLPEHRLSPAECTFAFVFRAAPSGKGDS